MLTLKMTVFKGWHLWRALEFIKCFQSSQTIHSAQGQWGHWALDSVLGTRGSTLCQLTPLELFILWLEQLVFSCQLDKSRIIWEESLSEASSTSGWSVGTCVWDHLESVKPNLLWVAPFLRFGSWTTSVEKVSWVVSVHFSLHLPMNVGCAWLPWLPHNHGL